MTALAVSAAGPITAVAARGVDGTVATCTLPGRDLAGRLVATVDDLLHKLGANPTQVTRIGVDRGPGSYTGLRYALTFARTLAELADVAVVAITHVELLALAHLRAAGEGGGDVRVVLDARRDHVFTALLRADGGSLRTLEPARAVPRAAAAQLPPAQTTLVDPALADLLDGALPLPQPAPELLFDPALVWLPVDPEQLDPLYLLPSYAAPE